MKQIFPKKSKIYPVASNINLTTFTASCLDRRYRIGRRRFLEEELGLMPENIVPVKRAGGAGPLRRGKHGWKKIPKDLRKQAKLFMKHYPEISLIVLSTHENCHAFGKCKNRELSDLKKAVKIFSKRFPQKKVVGYFGRFVDENRQEIYFELVASS